VKIYRGRIDVTTTHAVAVQLACRLNGCACVCVAEAERSMAVSRLTRT